MSLTAAAGDSAVDVGGDRRGQSADRRAAAAARRRLRQARRGGVLLGSAAASRPLLAQVSARVLQTDVSTSRSGDRLCATPAPPAAAVSFSTERGL